MIYNFRNAKIFYRFVNKKSEVVNVYLHGWGASHSSLIFCQNHIKNQSGLFIDFPPFGESDKDIKGWSVFTYANMVISLCHKLGIKKINIVGHSFGGRIAIILAVICKEDVEKIVLIDSAGVKPKRSLFYYFKIFAYKIKKRLRLDTSKYGSCDYLALSPHMRKTFNNVVNTHLDDFLPYIRCKALIIFGEKDKVTPIYMAKKMKKKIKKSKLVLLPESGHFSFVDRKIEFLAELKSFLNEE